MRRQFAVFLLRWLLNSFGLWIAVRLLGEGIVASDLQNTVSLFLCAGLIFSILNTLVRPALIILSLPAIMLTLGLFIFIVNGALVWLSIYLTPTISMTFLNAIFTGMLLSLINYIISGTIVLQTTKSN